MPKEFYTEKDIEDFVKRGVMSLEVNGDVVLTELAWEKAGRLGMKLVREKPDQPPCAPVRPYISERHMRPAAPAAASCCRTEEGAGESSSCCRAAAAAPAPSDVRERIRSAVIARMGPQVEPHLLDQIIRRVLESAGVK